MDMDGLTLGMCVGVCGVRWRKQPHEAVVMGSLGQMAQGMRMVGVAF